MLENKVIVIKKEGDKLLLPTKERREVNAPSNGPSKSYCMCRIISYDPLSGTMNLKPATDIVNDKAYKISTEVNSDLLSTLLIKEILFTEHLFIHPTLNITPQKNTYTHSDEASLVQEKTNRPNPVKLDIELPVKHISFLDGKVSFEHYISLVRKNIRFNIDNPFLKKEYDSIKNYFSKALKTEKFAISIQFEYLNEEIFNSTCSSPHIMSIDEKLFELVTDMYINDYIINGDEKDIYSLKELALEVSKNIGAEEAQDAEKILDKIITPERTKHYHHLRYLSDKHLSTDFNLRVTGKPLSFIFLLSGGNNYYLIWETYLTEEATYVWKISGREILDLEAEVMSHVDRIKWLRAKKKMAYLKTKPADFIRIEHEYTGRDMGFKRWKIQLEKFILNR